MSTPRVNVLCPDISNAMSTCARWSNITAIKTYFGETQLLILDDSPERSTFLDDPIYREQNVLLDHCRPYHVKVKMSASPRPIRYDLATTSRRA